MHAHGGEPHSASARIDALATALHGANLATPYRFCVTIWLKRAGAFYDRGGFAMATMIDGESYVGRVLIRPLSQSGDLRLYCWPLRCLKSKMGGPTFGIEVKGEEILRFDAHGPRGHWHKGGYVIL